MIIFFRFGRIMENYEIRVLLRHYWKQEFKANEAARKIVEGRGRGSGRRRGRLSSYSAKMVQKVQ